MRLIHVTVGIKSLARSDGSYEAQFLVDTGATDSLAPQAQLRRIGIEPVGSMAYELADGTLQGVSLRPGSDLFRGRDHCGADYLWPG